MTEVRTVKKPGVCVIGCSKVITSILEIFEKKNDIITSSGFDLSLPLCKTCLVLHCPCVQKELRKHTEIVFAFCFWMFYNFQHNEGADARVIETMLPTHQITITLCQFAWTSGNCSIVNNSAFCMTMGKLDFQQSLSR